MVASLARILLVVVVALSFAVVLLQFSLLQCHPPGPYDTGDESDAEWDGSSQRLLPRRPSQSHHRGDSGASPANHHPNVKQSHDPSPRVEEPVAVAGDMVRKYERGTMIDGTAQHATPPPGYLAACRKRPVADAVATVAHDQQECIRDEEWDLFDALREARESKCDPSAKMDLRHFACLARCAEVEPELERTFRILNVADYELHGLLRLCQSGSFPYLVRIVDNRISYRKCQTDPTGILDQSLEFLKSLTCSFRLPDIVFGFDGNDYAVPQSKSPLAYASAGWIHPLPGVLRLVGTDAHPCGLFPTPPFLERMGFADPYHPRREQHGALKSWEERNSTIFWRGGCTGIPLDYDWTYTMPRPALGKKVKGLEGFDYGMTNTEGVSEQMIRQGFKENVRLTKSIRSWEFLEYKYHLHLDGNTASWSLIAKLTMDAIVIWHRSPVTYREHYYDLLKPWVHYVPLESDMSNLEQIRDWLSSSGGQREVLDMKDRLKEFIKKRLRPEDLLCYTLRLLESMAALQGFDPKKEFVAMAPEFFPLDEMIDF